MSTKLDNYDSNEIQIEHAPGVDESLYPKKITNER